MGRPRCSLAIGPRSAPLHAVTPRSSCSLATATPQCAVPARSSPLQPVASRCIWLQVKEILLQNHELIKDLEKTEQLLQISQKMATTHKEEAEGTKRTTQEEAARLRRSLAQRTQELTDAKRALLHLQEQLSSVQARLASAVTYSHIPSHTFTYRYIPLHTVTYRRTPSHTVAYRHIPLHTLTNRYIPLSSVQERLASASRGRDHRDARAPLLPINDGESVADSTISEGAVTLRYTPLHPVTTSKGAVTPRYTRYDPYGCGYTPLHLVNPVTTSEGAVTPHYTQFTPTPLTRAHSRPLASSRCNGM